MAEKVDELLNKLIRLESSKHTRKAQQLQNMSSSQVKVLSNVLEYSEKVDLVSEMQSKKIESVLEIVLESGEAVCI